MRENSKMFVDIMELVKHVSLTPVFERPAASKAALKGRKVRMQRRKQRTDLLLKRVQRHFR